MKERNQTIEQAIKNIHANNLPLHPNSVIHQTHKLDDSITDGEVTTYMQSVYGWSEDFYSYYGDSTDLDE